MKKLNFVLSAIGMCCFYSCINVNTDANKDEAQTSVEVKTNVQEEKSKIRNGIILEENGIKVEQAFLLYEDNTLVPESNETEINKKVYCRIIIDKGFEEKDGKVYLGTSEIIETNNGEIVLEEKDMFQSYDETGVNPEDAKFITLSAVITKIDKLYDYFNVKFKVWDKTGTGSVNGSFKLKLK